MQCPRCQAENREGRRFCAECGASLAGACPSCGFSNEPDVKFCGGCGRALSASPHARRLASPDAYTPKHLAAKIAASRGALEGERKQVTVLFADLKGSMELVAGRDPEDARRLLDPVLERMMGAVHRYEGTVNQVMGDGIMALFGAPVAHEDHAVRACYAALAMQDSVRRYAEEAQRTEGIPLHIRVGLNSGEVVVRSIGSDLHMDYTAVGQTTHLAARLEQMAMPGSSLISGDVLRLAEGYVQVRPLGAARIKGLSEPVEVHELIGVGSARSRLQAAAARGFTRFVGREAELDQLRHGLERARAGHGQVVALVGEPGVGKSRLFREFIHSPQTRDWLILETRTVSYGKATSYLPVIALLKLYFRIEDRDDERQVREKVTGKLLTLDDALPAMLPPFLTLLDISVEDTEWRGLNPAQRRQRTLEAMKRLLLRESEVQPVCLAFEDLHWADSETQACLDRVIDGLPTARLLLLLNYRPEYQHGWGSRSYYTQVRIDPLPPESAEVLLEGLLGERPDLEPLKRFLIERTGGNPFFLEESVRTLVETRVLAGDRGQYRLTKSLTTLQVPASVQAVLAARIDRLPLEEKHLLQAAAVVGKDVPVSVLRAIADRPDDALTQGLAHLQAGELLYETSLFPDLEYTFTHALTHEVAYGGLLHDHRRTLHARIVDAIERLYATRLGEQVERLAHHAIMGEVWGKALFYVRQAGAKAAAYAAHREAIAYFEQALAVLPHVPESRDAREQAIDLRFDLRNSLFPLGEHERIHDCLREAEALAETLGDQSRLGRVSSYLTNHFLAIGDHARAIAAGERALAIAATHTDPVLELTTNFYLAQVYAATGDYRRAIAVNRKTVATLETGSPPERFGQSAMLGLSRLWLLWGLAEVGEFGEGLARGAEAIRKVEAADQPFDRLLAYLGMGLLALRKGELPEAIAVLERGLGLARTDTLSIWFPGVASPLGYAYALSGNLAEAIPILEQAVAQTAAMRRVGHALRIVHLGEAYLLGGQRDEAVSLAVEALRLSREHKERAHQAYANRLLAEIASHADPPDPESADHYYREAITLAEELGMRPLLAHCHLGLGRLCRRTGNRQTTQEHLTAAARLYQEMDMTLWLESLDAG